MTATAPGQFFDGYAADFDAIYGGKRRGVSRLLDRALRRSMLLRYQRSISGCTPIEGRTALDVGTGPGHYAVALARRGAARVVGVDPAPGMLKLARAHAQLAGVEDRCEFVDATLEGYAPGERFDYVIIMGVMDYVADPRPFVELALARAKVRAFFSFPAAGGLLAALRSYRYRRRTPLFLYTRRDLDALFAAVAPSRHSIVKIARDFFVEVRAGDA